MKRALRWLLVLPFLGLAIAGPSWAEETAAARIDQAVGSCGDRDCVSSIDIDFGGLSLSNATLRVGDHVAEVERIRVEPRLDGLHLHVEGLDGHLSRPRSHATKPAKPGEPSAPSKPRPPKTAALMGIPVFVTATGRVEVNGPESLRLEVVDPNLAVDTTGSVRASGLARLHRGDLLLGQAEVTSARADGHLDQWEVDATARLLDGEPIPLTALLSRQEIRAHIASGEGTAEVELQLGARPRLSVHAEQLHLGFVPAGQILPPQIRANIDQAVIDGTLTIERSDAWEAELDDLEVDGLVVDAPFLSKEPLHLLRTGLDGSLALRDGRVEADVVVSHGHAQADANGTVSREAVDLTASLAPLPCQALLESMPSGFVSNLEGMQFLGEVDAFARVQFEFDDVMQRHEALKTDEPADDVSERVPGVIELDFPFLEQCEVLRDAPGVDLDALATGYRHRFLTDAGDERTQVLIGGAEDFVPIASVPNLANAFVILEDSRFWEHDGFDRDQIERAFWHNLGAKGFSRGASTISQQTARNLWLGHERSLARKIQEAVLTARLESQLDKRRILEIYVNIIELGPGVHGVAEAARYHFGREANELSLIEALHIAALAPAPVTYSHRFDDGEADAAWQTRLRDQIRRLRAHGMITHESMQTELWAPLRLRSRPGVPVE